MEEQKNEQAIAEVTIIMEWEAFRRFGRFAWFHWPQNIALFIFAIVVMPLMLVFLYIVAFVWPGSDRLAPLTVALTAAYIAMLYITLTARKRAWRRLSQTQPLPQTYVFYEEQLILTGGMQYAQGTEQIQYELFNRVYETKHAFYMTLLKTKNFILDKKFFAEDQITALRELLVRKFGDKFKGMK